MDMMERMRKAMSRWRLPHVACLMCLLATCICNLRFDFFRIRGLMRMYSC